MKTSTHVFKTFPEFSELTFQDRDKYNQVINSFPPISNYSFANLMTWWSALDPCKIAQINDNYVISYWMPGESETSGLSLIGTNKIDETVCNLLDYLAQNEREPKLVHVPEFVISNMRYPEMFKIDTNRGLDECILSINDILKEGDGKSKLPFARVELLDTSDYKNQQKLVECAEKWKKGVFNDIGKHEDECLKNSVWYANDLGCEVSGLFINDELVSFLVWQIPHNRDYAIINFGRFNYAVPHVFELSVYLFADYFKQNGFKYLNIENDLGIPALRGAKLKLKPHSYFRLYEISPIGDKA